MEVIYYESHITIEPVFNERLELFRELCKDYGFQAADLLMQKKRENKPERSDKDTFCTGRGRDFNALKARMHRLVAQLEDHDYSVWREKIEAVLYDRRLKDAQALHSSEGALHTQNVEGVENRQGPNPSD
jgi:hypothetical protein